MVEPRDTTRLLTVAEAAERCRVSRPTYYRLARAGIVPAVRIGGSIRVDEAELEGYIFCDPAEAPGAPPGPAVPAERRRPEKVAPEVDLRPPAGKGR